MNAEVCVCVSVLGPRWVGALVLALPLGLCGVMWPRFGGSGLHSMQSEDSLVHMTVAYAVGCLMAYLADWYRRWGGGEGQGQWRER